MLTASTRFFYKKTVFFCLRLNSLNRMLEYEAEILLMFFLTSISIVFVYFVRFNTNNKRHFVTYMLTIVFNVTTYYGTAIKNEDRRKF